MSGYVPPSLLDALIVLGGSPYSPPSATVAHLVLSAGAGAAGPVYQTPPGLMISTGARWDGAVAAAAINSLPHGNAPKRDTQKVGPWAQASIVLDDYRQQPWSKVPQRDIGKASMWELALPLERYSGLQWSLVPKKDLTDLVPWAVASLVVNQRVSGDYNNAGWRDDTLVAAHSSTHKHEVDEPVPAPIEGAVVTLRAPYNPALSSLSSLDYVLRGKYVPPEMVPRIIPASERNYRRKDTALLPSRYGTSGTQDIFARLPWGRGQYYRKQREWGVPYPEYDGPIGFKDPAVQPEIKLSYQIMNTVNVVTLPGLVPVNLRDISLELDIDTWAWSLTGTVKGAASLAQIKPTASGPVDIQVTVNGHVFVIMIQRYSRNRQLADDSYTVHGSSRTQYLAAPYAPKLNAVNGSAINAKQAVEDLLLNTGFTLDWNTLGDEATPDWNIPAGALAYTGKTPMEVIKWIADAAGAVVLPDLASDTIIIKPRFPTPPWALSGATMDRIITASMVKSESEDWQPGELYNAAYVSGINLGRGTMVTRQGTAGDLPAPDTFSELQVAVECNQARGEAIIAASGNRSLHDLELHIPESATAPGLVLPGHEIEYQDIGQTWRGYVVSTKISAAGSGAAPLWQTIKVDRYLEH